MTYFGTSAPVHPVLPQGRACARATSYDLSALRAIGSTGAPLSSEGFRWIGDAVGEHVQICSVSGGTDVCTAFVGSRPDRAGVARRALLRARSAPPSPPTTSRATSSSTRSASW